MITGKLFKENKLKKVKSDEKLRFVLHPLTDTSVLFSFLPALESVLLHGERSEDACESACDSRTSGPADCMVLHHPHFRGMVFLCGNQILSPRS